MRETTLARHEARIAERDLAAAHIGEALDDYRARHTTLRDTPSTQARSIGTWCDETREAIDTWRAMTMADERDPVLADTAAVLENIIAFEGRARNLHTRWNDVGIASTAEGTASPFLAPVGEAVAADLRTLKAGLPRSCVMLSSLQQALADLDRHESRIAERDKAAARFAKALDDYRACHEPIEDTATELTGIRVWCHETDRSIGAWRAITEPPERDPALSETAVILESLIAFEGRARALLYRWQIARIGGDASSPFLNQDDTALAADLRDLEAGLPDHAMMLHDLRPAFERLAEHERSVAEARELVERAAEVDDARRSLLEREGRTSRPLNRRFNKAWKRWREAAEAVAAEIDATDAALIAHVDENGVASRVRAAFATSDRLDDLPGWLLLRLHDNAVAAGATMHPAMTEDYAGIMREMVRLEQSLKEKDPRRRVLRGEINRHHMLGETQRKVASLLGELKAHNAEAASLDGAARSESLPIQQSMAWARWYNHSRRLEEQARTVLAGGGDHGRVLHDGKGTRQAFEEAIALFGKTRTAHGEPDASARLERLRKEDEERKRTQSRHRGGGLSM
ncbi:MAG: hypothetical protein OXD40_08565 [bacterium]|nr:hypothetical protein [bacterium]